MHMGDKACEKSYDLLLISIILVDLMFQEREIMSLFEHLICFLFQHKMMKNI